MAALDLFDLSGCVAVVTGGARGIGSAITEGLASAGAATVIADVLAQEGREAAARLRARGQTAAFVPFDVRKRDSVARSSSRIAGCMRSARQACPSSRACWRWSGRNTTST